MHSVDLPKRKQIRLKDHDYSQSGYYFVTICTYKRQNLFGEIKPSNNNKTYTVGADASVRPNDEKCEQPEIKLSSIGKIVDECWNNINKMYSGVRTDYYVIMPDHFHGIIVINDDCTGGQRRPPLPKIVQGFKSVTTRKSFQYGHSKIWQRGYYEHIIRDEADYIQKADYIANNPIKGELSKIE